MLSAKEKCLRELPDLLWAARTYRKIAPYYRLHQEPPETLLQELRAAEELLDSYEPMGDDFGVCNTYAGKDLEC